MNNASKQQTFKLPRPRVDDENGNLRMTFQFHLPNSFMKRVWLNLETIKLSYLLFDFVMGLYLQQHIRQTAQAGTTSMYNNLPHCKYVLQLMLKSMSEQGQQRMYISSLTDICLLFDLDVILTYKNTIILPNCSNGTEKKLLLAIQDQTLQAKD